MKEIELKLRVNPEQVEAIKQSELINSYSNNKPVTHLVRNWYFDTSDYALQKHGYALRIREAAHHYWQTLKHKGEVQNGLHVRQEWEVEIPSCDLRWELLPAEILNPLKVSQDEIEEIFEIEFIRTRWHCEFPGDESVIEVALDMGEIIGAESSQPILELELELKAGNKQRLFALASELQQVFDLHPFDDSKAKRGYALAKVR